jgi:hypothetical protein
MKEYSHVKETNDGEQLPRRNKGDDCGKRESKEMLATDKNTCL